MTYTNKKTKKLYFSTNININWLKQINDFLKNEKILTVELNDDFEIPLMKLPAESSIYLFLLDEMDVLKRDYAFWKRIKNAKEIPCFLIIPLFLSDEKLKLFEKLNLPSSIFHYPISYPFNFENLKQAVLSGFKNLILKQENSLLHKRLTQRHREFKELNQIGKMILTEKNYNDLINLILTKGKLLTNADSASLSIIEKDINGKKKLRFILSDLKLHENLIPLTKKSIVGYVVLTGKGLNISDAYNLPKDVGYSLNLEYDKKNNYHTTSLLVIPMKNQKGKVIGVLQLINKMKNHKRSSSFNISDVISFDRHDMELAISIAGQAAFAIENNRFEEKSREIEVLTNIGKALATEKDFNKLLSLILSKVKKLTQCDSGSIYIVEQDKSGNKTLCFKQSSLKLDEGEFSFAISKNSISGYVALTGKVLSLKDVYNLPNDAEYSLNLEYDKKHYYKTKSMLVVPMTNHSNEVIGVLQLINKKRYPDISFDSIESIEKYTINFDSHDIELVKSVAGQAAVSIENNILYRNIENLFEGFVKASVYAIESRDPPTSGHSERVAIYTVGLAEAVNTLDSGKWEKINFNSDQIKEIRYASLLHDFGKVGVREEVLLKASKLYPYELEFIKSRFKLIKKTLENQFLKKKVQYLLEKDRNKALTLIKNEDSILKNKLEEVDKALELVIFNNNPKVVEEKVNLNYLKEIANKTILDSNGDYINYITDRELSYLSIGKGSLGYKERKEIESHVSHTFEFLSQIPWTSELNSIPEIAYAHHERLNSKGYPNNLSGDSIPNQSKLIAVSDIYDALTAGDRPYKVAVSQSEALDILKLEVNSNHIDSELVRLFIDAKIYKLTSKK